jgi:hypothetical protein
MEPDPGGSKNIWILRIWIRNTAKKAKFSAAEPREAIPLPERRQPAGTQTPSPGRRARLPLSSSPGKSSLISFSISDPGSNNNKKEEGKKLVVLPVFSVFFWKL